MARRPTAATISLGLVLLAASGCSVKATAHSAEPVASRCQQVQQLNARRDDQRPVTTGKTVAVVLGDSYAQGLSFDSDPREQTWPAPLGEQLQWTTYVNAIGRTGFVNGGACGGQQYASRIPAVLALHPAVVVVEGGLNDTSSTENLVAAAHHLLFALRSVPTVDVVGPTAAPGLDLTALEKVDAILSEAAWASGRTYISALDWKLPFVFDRVHLTAEGQKQFAELVANSLS